MRRRKPTRDPFCERAERRHAVARLTGRGHGFTAALLGPGADAPERGEVVVFRSPENGQRWIKRVVGLPGDWVEERGGIHEVPAGHCFVLGDPRANSRDSRHVGPVPLEDVEGVVPGM